MTSYVIITPAFNEADYIGKTIDSVLGQTVRPLIWVIVDDGSTDRTAEIVKHYAAQHPWIRYVFRSKESGQSYYGSNVYAIMTGYELVKTLEFVFLAVLDADITLPKDYYEQIFMRFEETRSLGLLLVYIRIWLMVSYIEC